MWNCTHVQCHSFGCKYVDLVFFPQECHPSPLHIFPQCIASFPAVHDPGTSGAHRENLISSRELTLSVRRCVVALNVLPVSGSWSICVGVRLPWTAWICISAYLLFQSKEKEFSDLYILLGLRSHWTSLCQPPFARHYVCAARWTIYLHFHVISRAGFVMSFLF